MLSKTLLIDSYWPREERGSILRSFTLVFLGTVILAVSAHIKIPFWPVPTTMQSFAVVFLGALYGRRLAFATVLLYLAEGCSGLPVFAAGTTSSIANLAGPTGGYLVGFIPAAWVSGFLAGRDSERTIGSAARIFLAGFIVIELPGLLWLAFYLGGIGKALVASSIYQFATLFKVGFGSAVLPLLWGVTRGNLQNR